MSQFTEYKNSCTHTHVKKQTSLSSTYLLCLNHVGKFGMYTVGHSVCALVCQSDQNSCPTPEADTLRDHRTALIRTQHSGCASPKGIWKQMEGCRRTRDGKEGGVSGIKGKRQIM